MRTGAKSIGRFINRVTLVRSTFVARVSRRTEYSDPTLAPGDLDSRDVFLLVGSDHARASFASSVTEESTILRYMYT